MKPSEKLVRNLPFIAGGIAVISALLLAVLIALSAFGCLVPRKIALSIATDTTSKTYDGEALVGTYHIEKGKLAPGHEIDVLFQSELSTVGSIENDMEFRIVDPTDADVTDRYDITIHTGMLSVHPMPLSIRTGTSSKLYDGEPLSNDKISISGNLLPSHTVTVVSTTEQIDIGSTENNLTLQIVDGNGNKVGQYYDVTVTTGKLEVKRIPISVTTETVARVYDGEPLVSNGFTLTSGKLLTGHSLYARTQNTLEGIGSMTNNLDIGVKDLSGNDVSEYYTINRSYGRLSISARPIHLTTESESRMYDGSPLKNENYSLSSGTLCPGHSLYIKSSPVLEGTGTLANELKMGVRNLYGVDVTDCYNITFTAGRLTVTPRPLNVTTTGVSKEYDGTTVGGEYYLSGGSLCLGHVLYVKSATQMTAIGTMDNVISLGVRNEKGQDVSSCYDFTYQYGKLSLTARSICIQTASITKPYTGSNIFDDSYTIVSGSLCPGEVLQITGTRRSQIGMSFNDVLSYKIIRTNPNGSTQDVTAFYKLSYQSGTITVTAPK